MIRTHEAGSLRAGHVGETVTLTGWVARRRDHGGVAFIDLRDASGVSQVVIRDEEVAHPLRSEFCLKVTGEVATRPEGNANPNLPTGDIEVIRLEHEVIHGEKRNEELAIAEKRYRSRYAQLVKPPSTEVVQPPDPAKLARSSAAQVAKGSEPGTPRRIPKLTGH